MSARGNHWERLAAELLKIFIGWLISSHRERRHRRNGHSRVRSPATPPNSSLPISAAPHARSRKPVASLVDAPGPASPPVRTGPHRDYLMLQYNIGRIRPFQRLQSSPCQPQTHFGQDTRTKT